jgi:hypothetical protein
MRRLVVHIIFEKDAIATVANTADATTDATPLELM